MRWFLAAILLAVGLSDAWAQTGPGSRRGIPPSHYRPKVFGPVCSIPEGAVRVGTWEHTLLQYQVNVSGRITNTTVVSSSGNPVLDHAAIFCLSNWHADPSE